MSRKRIKNRKKTHGDALKPFTKDGIRYYPLETQGGNVLDPSGIPSEMNQDQFMYMTHEMSDTQLNELMCWQVQDAIDLGLNPDWPEDDFGIVMWFIWSFLTDEMREAFPAIAREYLEHEELIDKGEEYQDIPYPLMNETTWHDAYYFRVLSIMLMSARKGSVYSKNYLLSLYKVYYRQEYNRLKKLKTLHYRDLLEIFKEYGEVEVREEFDKVLIAIHGSDDEGLFTAAGAYSTEEFMAGDEKFLEQAVGSILYYNKQYDAA